MKKIIAIIMMICMCISMFPISVFASTYTTKEMQKQTYEGTKITFKFKGKKYIGKTLNVLVDGFDRYAECYFGRSVLDAPEVDPCVFFTINDKKPMSGDIVKVKITDYIDCDLAGEMEE